jgi:hypothetical protein
MNAPWLLAICTWNFGDLRLKKTLELLIERMLSKLTVCLRKLGEDRAGEVRFGRFLANKKVTTERLTEGICAPTALSAAGRHVLMIEDTTEINYQAHAGRVKGLGTVGNGKDLGLFLHPLLAVDAENGACLGLAAIHLWLRTKSADPKYHKLPIEDKESYRWLTTAQAGKECLADAQRLTVIADRESDIYEMWARLPDERTDLLLRACHDRAVETEHGSLFTWLSGLDVAGTYTHPVRARAGKRSAHVALLHVRYGRVKIKRPLHCSDPNAPESIEVTAIDVVEDASSVVGAEEPIHWRLLTTHTIETMSDARRIIGWYSQRWHIEQTFRTLKKQGMNIESSQVETADGLKKLVCLALGVAVRTMQLTLARDDQSDSPASDVFSESEIEILIQIQPTLEGKTEKQKNWQPVRSLAWASWMIARMGGWKGYASERKPGPITMHYGLTRFALIAAGWHAAMAVKNVCIP